MDGAQETKEVFKNAELVCRVAGVISGLMLAAANIYPMAAPLQLVAFIGVLYLAASGVRSGAMLAAGIYMGLAYSLPQMFLLRLPVPMTLILLAEMTIVMAVFAWGCGKLINRSAIMGAFAVGAFLVVLDWMSFTAVPIWGTAQSLGRCWSRYPSVIGFSEFTGITGIVFVIGTLQTLAVNFILRPKEREKLAVTGAAVILVIAGVDTAVRYQHPIGTLKVGAIGWTLNDSAKYGKVYSPIGFESLFTEPARRAAKEGAKLIVSPELGFEFGGNIREEWVEKFRQIAAECNVFLAIGYFDTDEEKNKLMFMSDKGKVIGEYIKTHLTAFEDYHKGDGRLETIEVCGIRVGGMICQDDNFTRLSREYGRREVGVVAVPTLDWFQVKDAHLQNSKHRAIESRYAVVRASLNGISAIISPKGEIVAVKDHFKEGAGVIVAEVPIYTGQTLFSRSGHWPVGVSMVFLACWIVKRLWQAEIMKDMIVTNCEGTKL